jgi:hypothetical protein
MDLKEHFGPRHGTGLLASHDAEGGLDATMTRPSLTATERRAGGPKCLMTFAVGKVFPLVGAG